MSKLGQEIIQGLKEFIRDAKAGKPMRQSVVRRMTVKGKTTYVHTTFTAPIVTRRGGESEAR